MSYRTKKKLGGQNVIYHKKEIVLPISSPVKMSCGALEV